MYLRLSIPGTFSCENFSLHSRKKSEESNSRVDPNKLDRRNLRTNLVRIVECVQNNTKRKQNKGFFVFCSEKNSLFQRAWIIGKAHAKITMSSQHKKDAELSRISNNHRHTGSCSRCGKTCAIVLLCVSAQAGQSPGRKQLLWLRDTFRFCQTKQQPGRPKPSGQNAANDISCFSMRSERRA